MPLSVTSTDNENIIDSNRSKRPRSSLAVSQFIYLCLCLLEIVLIQIYSVSDVEKRR